MKTTIESEFRVFMVTTNEGKCAFCNIEDLNTVVKEMKCREGYYSIYEVWNNKPRKMTQKRLNLFFTGAGLTQYFFY